jgi:hypothetical protein
MANTYLDGMEQTSVAHSIMSVFSGTFVDGHGIRVSKDRVFAMGKEYRAPAGFRAIAFWNSGDMSILRTMRLDYLLVDPARLSPRIHRRLEEESQLELLARESDTRRAQTREVYRIRLSPPNDPHAQPPDAEVTGAEFPVVVRPGGFYEIPILLRVASRSFDGEIEVGYRIYFENLVMNAGDEVRHRARMERSEAGKWKGKLFFVGPYDGGKYAVEVYAGDRSGILRGVSEPGTRYRIEVR